ncbi:TonB-dependent receptor [uncultured Prevotella sp.]|uniref:SusC/RagA family TonB-linked outer membrane protein n=1 Tax=uncultured Prevotella sp. TaxID=159272 RepID=UPI0027E2B0FC|nr:TonB-dependent receptor [uncultured Prevotella sp.]
MHKSNLLLKGLMLGVTASMYPAFGNATATSPATNNVANVQQESTTVTGIVLDDMGEPIIGATIKIKGQDTVGTITSIDGDFTLKGLKKGQTLVISYIGFQTQEVKYNGEKSLKVTLKSDSKSLNEVVVVGYGTQKKVNMSGAVASINMDELTESRPVTNVSQALAGLAAGVNVSSGSNRPGDDNASILVRGQGTLNSSAPLIIIDGVEQGINTVNPQDIESVSVLKDAASASIYGSRAANGVILITTKKGKSGKIKVDYNGYVSFQSIRKTLTPVSNYADYMELINEGYYNSNPKSGKNQYFSEEKIAEWRNGNDPLKYPNTNWIDETFKPSTSTNHVVSLSGGSDKIRFYGSFGYMNNPGVLENAGMKKYTVRLNMDADVTAWLNIGMQIGGYVSDLEPGAEEIDNIFTYTAATTPGMVFRAPDGRYGALNNSEDSGQCANNNPLIRLNKWAGQDRKNNVRPRFTATLKPFKGFSLTGSYSYEFLDRETHRKPVFLDAYNFLTDEQTWTNRGKTSIKYTDSKIERYFNDLVARYDTKMFKNNLAIGAMAGLSNELYRSKNFSATRQDLTDLSMDVINGATGESTSSGSSTEWAMRSFFGRLNLNWQEKYLFEFNLRADGSSRFSKDNRWGYFPSASAAWRIDQEKFMEGVLGGNLSNLKLRVSYGALGNNSVGNYDYQSLYTTSGNNYVLGNLMVPGLALAAISNSALTWESTKVFNVGLDFGFFNNHLTGTIDFFNKKTTGILINLPAPGVHGTTALPKQNSAEVTNKGIEFTLGWQDKIGDFTYGANANFAYITNNVDKFKGKDKGGMSISGANLIWEGHSINSQYLMRVDRILQTDEDMKIVDEMIAKNPNAFKALGKPQKGDFLYKDIDGDGCITLMDKEIVSDGTNPKFTFGLNLNAAYKGFDVSALLQGQLGIKTFWMNDAYNTPTVRYGYQINKEVADGRWYEGRTDAKYPRLIQYQDTRNTKPSDFYLQDRSFLKIRNIQFGYTVPQNLTQMVHVQRVRVYCSLENFFTFTSFKGFDPEVSGMNYPTMKQCTLGLNISF